MFKHGHCPHKHSCSADKQQTLILAECFAWLSHSSPHLECVRPGSLSVTELQRQCLSPLIDRAFVLTAPLLRNARWGFVAQCSPVTHLPLRQLPHSLRLTEAGRPMAAPLSGTESHTGLIHLALGNRHLSLRMPQGTHRHSLILGWGARRCDALWNTYRWMHTYTPAYVLQYD